MAEFCKKCVVDVMGITKDAFPDLSMKEFKVLRSAWTTPEGDVCEGCGFEYLKKYPSCTAPRGQYCSKHGCTHEM